jgi:hypothetical protein
MLQIGDQWNAISIIAQSQTHPLKAVCELVENAIDARARNIHIVRRRTNDQVMLEVVDDGHGVPLDQDGRPHFCHIATHLCDSMKRHLSRRLRHGVHGEFGIGLLSFWSLGQQLRIIASDGDGRLHELVLNRGEQSYSISPVRGGPAGGGTQIIVGPLLEWGAPPGAARKSLLARCWNQLATSVLETSYGDTWQANFAIEFEPAPCEFRFQTESRVGNWL